MLFMISSFFFKQNTRIFSAYNGRKIRIFSLGRKNNILMQKSVTMVVKITIVNICFVNAVELTNNEVYTLVILTDGFDRVLIVADFTLIDLLV